MTEADWRNTRIRIQFLGSGDAFGSGGRLQSCILLTVPDARLLLDCGASSLIAMRAASVEPNDIDAILVSHLHGDHFGGIPYFILDAQLVSKRTKPLQLVGPPGMRDRLHAAMEVDFPGSSRVQQRFEIRYRELEPRRTTPVDAGGLSVTAFPVDHFSGAPSYALRMEVVGRCLAYSGDTAWTDSLVEASEGSDLFICEAYFYEKRVKFHLDYRTLMAHRDELGAKRILLTHLSADMLSRLDDVELETAQDGLALDL